MKTGALKNDLGTHWGWYGGCDAKVKARHPSEMPCYLSMDGSGSSHIGSKYFHTDSDCDSSPDFAWDRDVYDHASTLRSSLQFWGGRDSQG